MISDSVVIDTNLLFSALIPKASKIREILFESNLKFYSPNILISEIYKHKDKLIKHSKLKTQTFQTKNTNIPNKKHKHSKIVGLALSYAKPF